jgi:ATP-dependent DNA helicase DinG
MSELKQTVLGITRDAFAEGGALSKIFRNYMPNPVQIEYAEKVASIFENGSNSEPAVGLLEAGTGIGKTLGYAIPLFAYAALHKKRVAISTFTTQLQSQLLKPAGDIEIAQQIIRDFTGTSLSVAPRMGLSNFVSPLRIAFALAEKGIKEDKVSDSLKLFIKWADESKTGLLSEWNLRHGEIPSELSLSEICCEHNLPTDEKLRYEIHKDRAKSADVIVTNHTLTLMHALSKEMAILDNQDDRPLSVIVIDEADRVESAAELMTSRAAALHSMTSLFFNETDKASKLIANGIQDICKLVADFDPQNKSFLDVRDHPKILSEIELRLNTILPLFDQSANRCNNSEMYADILAHKESLSRFLNRSAFGTSTSSIPVISFSEVRRYPSLRLVDPNPATALGFLWRNDAQQDRKSYLDSVLLTSATLSDGKESSLKNVANTMGLFLARRHQLITGIFEPKDFGRISITLPDKNAPIPTLKQEDIDEYSTSPEWINYMAKMIIKASSSGERVVALTLSYRDTRLIADAIHQQHGTLSLIQHTESDSTQDLLSQFASTEGAILLSPSCWEGVNLPGLVKNLVITRIPFTPPDPVRIQITRENMSRRGLSMSSIKSMIYATSVCSTRRKLRQAIGRGIRQKSDVCRVWFGDKRIHEQNGKLRLDSCLPSRFVPELKTADTFLLDGSVLHAELEEKPKSLVW